MYNENLQEENLCIVEFSDAEGAIEFALETWPDLVDSIEHANAIRRINAEFDEDKRWFCMFGICDICGDDSAIFIPVCAFYSSYSIAGIECHECGMMAVYIKELEE